MLWTAFILGMFGSLHCVGMCGPIVLALPVYKGAPLKLIISRVLYNSGRILTYGIFGAIIGILGESLSFAGIQQKLSIIAGTLIIIFAIFSNKKFSSIFDKGLFGINQIVKQKIGNFIRKRSVLSSFVVGFSNGFLPCGLVYLAIGGAFATGTFSGSVFYMILFGLGTSFAMFAFGIASNYFGLRFRMSFNKLIPYVAVFLGLLLIIRGLNLGIPYLSPLIDQSDNAAVCH